LLPSLRASRLNALSNDYVNTCFRLMYLVFNCADQSTYTHPLFVHTVNDVCGWKTECGDYSLHRVRDGDPNQLLSLLLGDPERTRIGFQHIC